MSFIKQFTAKLQEEGLETFGRYYSIYAGIIVDNEDPEFLGRLKIKVPQLHDEAPENWAMPRGMFCGTGIGFFCIPNKNDMVWITFLNGDPEYPIWEYGWFGKGDMISGVKNNENKPTKMVWASTSGHRIELDDKKGEETFLIKDKEGNTTTMNKDGVVMEDKFGHKIVMNDKAISLVSSDKVSLGTQNGSAEPGVLGNKNADVLTQIVSQLQNICTALTTFATTQATAAGAVPFTAGLVAGYTTLGTAIGMVSGALGSFNSLITATKSNKNSLD